MGLEGIRVEASPKEIQNNPENEPEPNITSKSELSQRDGSTINNTSNIRENESNKSDNVIQDNLPNQNNELQNIIADDCSDIVEEPKIPQKSNQTQK